MILDFLFPKTCPICRKPVMPKGALLHPECEKTVKYVKAPFCMKCGREIDDEREELCNTCRKSDFSFDMGRCIFDYHTPAGAALKEFKSIGTREYAEFFGKAVMHQADFLEAVSPSVVTPVPLHPTKLRVRGFNQAELLAEAIATEIGIPVVKLLEKRVKTVDQKELGKEERERNLSHAFSIAEGVEIPDKVLLVDDVYTTGSTINSCARVLKAAGVKKVYFICFGAATSESHE